MTLENLLAICQLHAHTAEPAAVKKLLHAHTAEPAAVKKLLDAAGRNLADARVDRISPDNRFDAAYKCVMQCAMLGLWAMMGTE